MWSSPVSSILRKATRKQGEPLNILTFPTHERYESNLCKTGHNFFAYRAEGIKDWNDTYAKIPSNYTLLDSRKGENQIPLYLDFDLVLSQNKFGQYQQARMIADTLHLPLVSLEHTLPYVNWSIAQIEDMSSMQGDINVFISNYSVREWCFDLNINTRVIKHCVDTELFNVGNKQRKKQLLSVVNDWVNRDWCCGFKTWQEIVRDDLPVRVVGDTQGLSKPADTIEDLVREYQESLIFLNTSSVSPVPTALLESMACGCCPITTATCMIPEIIEHGVNGYLSNSPETLRAYSIELLNNPSKAIQMGQAARKTIIRHFHQNRFIREWNDLFTEAANITYTGER